MTRVAARRFSGPRYAAIRAYRRHTQDTLAGELGVHPNTIWGWEANGRIPDADRLADSAEVLEVHLAAFYVEPGEDPADLSDLFDDFDPLELSRQIELAKKIS